MISSITSFFNKHFGADCTSEEDSAHQLNLAIAALLTEVATIDNEISNEEQAAIGQLLKSQLDLCDDEIKALQTLSYNELKEATDYYQFTSLIKDKFGAEQRVTMIEQLWQIALADGKIDHHEEHFIRKIADLLFVPHSAYIKAKFKILNNPNTP